MYARTWLRDRQHIKRSTGSIYGFRTLKALRNAFVWLILLPRFLVAAIMLWFVDFQCVRKRVLHRMRESDGSSDDPPLCISDSNRMFSLESLKAVWYGHKLDFFKTARLGDEAPNTEVVRPADRTRGRILDYARGARPLILNFGSCT
uniref:Iodothyronine deiodinase n=1 Tax=Denticeps clupeoides TaxID=299321 RepID=A0AAY4DM13_9TELE